MIGTTNMGEKLSEMIRSPKPSTARRGNFIDALKASLSRISKKLREMFSLTTISISVESGGLKTLVTRGRKVVQWQTVPLDPEIVREGVVIDPTRLGQRIRAGFRNPRKLPRKAIVSITGLHSLSRLVTLPKTPNRLLKEAISRESQRAMPVSLEQLDLSWQLLPSPNGALPVYVLAAPQNIINGHIQALSQQGIDPYLMDIKPLALARAANRQNAFILDIQTEDFDIVVVNDGIPVITRTILFPMGRGAIDVEEEERVVVIVEEFLRTIKYFENTYAKKSVPEETPLFLTGEASIDPTLQETIVRAVKFPITPLDPPLRYPSSFPVSVYATNVGLTLKELLPISSPDSEISSLSVDINVLPTRHRKQVKVSKKLLWALGMIAGIALLLPIYQGSLEANRETAIMRAQLSRAEQNVTLKALNTKRHFEFQQSVERVEASVGELEAGHLVFSGRKTPFAEPLEILVTTLPDGIRINSIGDNGGVISVTGDADNYANVVGYTQTLAQTSGFPDASILFVQGGAGTNQQDTKVSFQLSIGRFAPVKVQSRP